MSDIFAASVISGLFRRLVSKKTCRSFTQCSLPLIVYLNNFMLPKPATHWNKPGLIHQWYSETHMLHQWRCLWYTRPAVWSSADPVQRHLCRQSATSDSPVHLQAQDGNVRGGVTVHLTSSDLSAHCTGPAKDVYKAWSMWDLWELMVSSHKIGCLTFFFPSKPNTFISPTNERIAEEHNGN